jgi:hypothetical protein
LIPTGTLILGAVAGVLGERALGRPLDRFFTAMAERRRRRRMLRENRNYAIEGETILIADHRIFVAQFSSAGFRRTDLLCSILPKTDIRTLVSNSASREYITDIADLESEVERWSRQLEADPVQWNGAKAGLNELHISRTPVDEDPILSMRFQRSDQARFVATGNLWRTILKTYPGYSSRDSLPQVNPLFSQSFGLNATVETADGKVILARRGSRTSAWHGKWHISVNEGIQGNDATANELDLLAVLIRGINEELGIDLRTLDSPERFVTVHTLMLDVDRYEWGLLAHVDLSGTDWSEAEVNVARTQGGARDSWEATELRFLPFGDSKGVLQECANADEWIPHGLLNLVSSAVIRHERDASELRRALSSTSGHRGGSRTSG